MEIKLVFKTFCLNNEKINLTRLLKNVSKTIGSALKVFLYEKAHRKKWKLIKAEILNCIIVFHRSFCYIDFISFFQTIKEFLNFSCFTQLKKAFMWVKVNDLSEILTD